MNFIILLILSLSIFVYCSKFCNVEDVSFSTIKSKWLYTNLSWVYLNTSHLNQKIYIDETTVRSQIFHSLKKWESISLLTFYEDPYNISADIKVSFQSGNHNDGYNFDDKGGLLAHAFYPYNTSGKGVVHLDFAEEWTSTLLFTTLIHEFGHTFGLGHSSEINAIMYPYLGVKKIDFDKDDITAIQNMYGMKNKFSPISKYTTTVAPYITTTTAPYVKGLSIINSTIKNFYILNNKKMIKTLLDVLKKESLNKNGVW